MITTEVGDGRYPASFLFFPFPLSSRLFGLSNYRLGLQAPLLPIFFFRAMPGAWPGGFFRGISTRGKGKEDNFGPDLCPALWSFAVTILPVLCSRSDLPFPGIYFAHGFTRIAEYLLKAKWLLVVCRRRLVSFGL